MDIIKRELLRYVLRPLCLFVCLFVLNVIGDLCGKNDTLFSVPSFYTCLVRLTLPDLAILHVILCYFYHGATAPNGPRLDYRGFMITLRHTTVGRTPLDEWSVRPRDLCLTTHNIHKRQTSMPPAGFEPEIPTSERPHTHAVDRAATGIGNCVLRLLGVRIMNVFCTWCDFAAQSIERIQFTEKTKCKSEVAICIYGITGALIA